ncbi:Uncharacterised protein [Actinobacillus pleuropneumoniae]|nr:Uncharacterised protein [Actinobacillus pleuropneumoniae]
MVLYRNTFAKLTFFHGTFGSVDDITGKLTASGINIITASFAYNNRKTVFH